MKFPSYSVLFICSVFFFSSCEKKESKTESETGTTNALWGITCGNSTFVTVGRNGNILTSTDGSTWTTRTSGITNHMWGVTYGNNTFVTVSYGGYILTYSDGISWTSRTSGTTNALKGVTYKE